MITCISPPLRRQPGRGVSLILLLLLLLLHSHLFLFTFYHPSFVSRGFMHETRPYTLPIRRFFFLFFVFSTSQFAILPRWKTSSGPNVFRVRGPWVRLINTERPDRLVPTPRRLFFPLFSYSFSLSREMSADDTIAPVSIFIVVLFVWNFNIPSRLSSCFQIVVLSAVKSSPRLCAIIAKPDYIGRRLHCDHREFFICRFFR